MAIKGSCFCGEVKYKIEGKLRDARSCHCSMCRKAFNAQASAYAQVESEGFLWLSGEKLLTSYKSNNGSGLLFFIICDSTLCGTFDGHIHINTSHGHPKIPNKFLLTEATPILTHGEYFNKKCQLVLG